VAAADVPILAVNLGSLGFLTEVPLAEMYSTLEAVNQGHCPVEERSVLQCQLIRAEECITQHFALNDVVVNKSAISRLVDFDLHIDGNFVFSYKADGVIIATPTGSTAYSLAAGGPIMMPAVLGFVVTPVCPHSLTHRPLVVTDTAHVELIVESGHEEAFLSIDGQVGMPVLQGDRILCRRASHNVKLMRSTRTFFEVLRNKLKWGQR
jgi:NAD+ kinase